MDSTSTRDHAALAVKYAEDVCAGRIPNGHLGILACERFLNDLTRQGSPDFPFRFDPKLGGRPCRALEMFPHVKGKWARKRELLVLEPWQCFVIVNVYGWVRADDGRRRFIEAYLEVARKNAKSITLAGLGLYGLACDMEFGAEIFSGATTEKQAWEVFRPARLMAIRTPAFRLRYGVTVNASNITRLADGSRFEPLIGNPGDGSSPSVAIIDEYHEHKSDAQVDTMSTGMGAREQPIMWMITTAGTDVSGPCYEKRRQVVMTLRKDIINEELFGVIYTVDDDDDWTDPDVLAKANPNIDVSVDGDYLRKRQVEAQQSARKQNAFRTKHLNQWVGSKSAWLNLVEWGKQPARPPIDHFEGRRGFIALDFATKIDVAALQLVFPPADGDDFWSVFGSYFVPEDRLEEHGYSNASHYSQWVAEGLMTATEGATIDGDDVLDAVRDYCSRFDIAEFIYDPYQFTLGATQLEKEGIATVAYPNTVPRMSPAMKEVEKLVKDKQLAHGGCGVLKWMAGNVIAKEDAKENIFPRKETSDAKIDGMVALIMGVGRAMDYDPDEGRSVYEDRGIRQL